MYSLILLEAVYIQYKLYIPKVNNNNNAIVNNNLVFIFVQNFNYIN